MPKSLERVGFYLKLLVMTTSDIYTAEINKQFKYLATWLPGTKVELGDIGIVENKKFKRISNLINQNIPFKIKESDISVDYEYNSQGSVSVSTKLKGKIAPKNSLLNESDVGLQINFSKENAIFFKLNKAKSSSINNLIELGEILIERINQNNWDKKWVIVTELVKADSGTILISSSKNATIELKANGNIGMDNIDIANARFNFEILKSKDLSTKILAKNNLTPLLKFSKIKTSFLHPPKFDYGISKMITLDSKNNSLQTEYKFKNVSYEECEDL